jgi:hypothetical protein
MKTSEKLAFVKRQLKSYRSLARRSGSFQQWIELKMGVSRLTASELIRKARIDLRMEECDAPLNARCVPLIVEQENLAQAEPVSDDTQVDVVTVKTFTRTLSTATLREALSLPPDTVFYTEVPSGGDWSGMRIELGRECTLYATWIERE